MNKAEIKPPAHLKPASKRWFQSVVADFELESHHLRLLQAACEAWDRMTAARETLAAEGAYYRNRNDEPRPHPAIAIERDSRVAFAQMVRELGLDGLPEPDPRPPRVANRYAS